MPDPVLTPLQQYSIIGTVVLFVVSAIVASWSAQYHWYSGSPRRRARWAARWTSWRKAVARFLFFRSEADELYLRSVAGRVLGSVAGLLVVRGHLTGAVADESAFVPHRATNRSTTHARPLRLRSRHWSPVIRFTVR